jgi:RNA polymerase sigma-B factor
MSTGELNERRGDVSRLPNDALWPLRDEGSGARDELIRRYLPLARKLALRYQNPHESFDDLAQVANLGLVNAVDRYDPERGTSFSSFAMPTILGELKRHFRDTGWSVHVPRAAKELALRVQTGVSELTERLGRSPQVPELAQYLELTVEEVLDALDSAQAHYSSSLDAPVKEGDGESDTLGDTLGALDDSYALLETTSLLAREIRELPHLERVALTLRFQHNLKQREIAQRMECSQMQVSRLLRRACDRLADKLAY